MAGSAEAAISNMKSRPDENDWEYSEKFWKQYGYLPYGGNFYWQKNPWWWVYGYESKGFQADSIPRVARPYLRSLNTLGGYMHTVSIVGLTGWFFIFLMGVRRSHP